ncbi:hypothetical protein ACFOG5_16830 [Pedobacter fastidiosus]|uniref:Peptidase C39-like domain-containing protein n=1 Tax=Pedobacter fastidiosus TaxID=2765361 RepID=A0ABR7KRL9_9SPHI|nr:hypothetical protein [Pedobacter fastidiosus]MBC6110742.1 hypothetical protein [Pedobacter fastidiosus]
MLSSDGKMQNSSLDGEDQIGGAIGFCTRWPNGKCPKTGDCSIKCDLCLTVCATLSCTFFDCRPVCDLPSEPGTGGGGGGGGGGGNPAAPGGGGAYPPDDCGGNGQIPRAPKTNGDPGADANSVPVPPCIPKPIQLKLDVIANFLAITDADKQNFLLAHNNIYDALVTYLVIHGDTPENKEFVDWAVGYLMINPAINFNDFKSQFLPTTEVISNPDEDNWTDPDDVVLTDPDQTVYQQYQDNQPWPIIKQVIKFDDFVPNRYVAGSTTETVNCLILAKEQMAKKGYTVSGFYVGSPQIFQTYTETGEVNLTKTKQAISYMIEKLNNGIPVLVGIDAKAGAPLANKDHSTDHFIVIIGTGTDIKGKYFQFMDSSTNWPSLGASQNNKLYFDSVTGKITGKTMSQYGIRSGRHDFIVTQVRKSIKK